MCWDKVMHPLHQDEVVYAEASLLSQHLFPKQIYLNGILTLLVQDPRVDVDIDLGSQLLLLYAVLGGTHLRHSHTK